MSVTILINPTHLDERSLQARISLCLYNPQIFYILIIEFLFLSH